MKKPITPAPTQILGWMSKLSAAVFLSLLSFTSANAQWQMVGGVDVTTSLTYCSSMEVSSDGTPYVAFRDATSLNKLSVKKYNGSEWVYVGTAGFSAGIIDHTDIEIDGTGTPYVSFTDASLSNKACVMKFNGTTWVNVGTAGFSASTAFGMRMDLSTTGLPYVCFIDGTNTKPTVMRFNSTSWVTVGVAGIGMTNTVYSDFGSIAFRQNILGIELDAASNVYVAAVEAVNSVTRKASVFKFNGTAWSTLPDVGTSIGLSVDVSVDPVSSQPYLVYTAASQGPLSVKKYDGTNWLSVGAVAPFTGIANNVKIDFSNNKPVVANWNLSAGYRLDVYEFDGTTWNFVGGTVRPSNDSFVSAELGIDGTGNIYVGGFRQAGGGYFQAFKYCTSVPTITLAPITICGPDVAIITATPSPTNVVVNWYASATSTAVLGSGASFTTPSISANTTYYAEADNKGCASTRGSSFVTVKTTPVISAASATPICGTSGTSTLTATATTGSTITWYPIANAGLASGTGSPFTTPVLTSNRNYYAEATLNGCKSTPRTLVVAALQTTVPAITSTTPNATCGGVPVTLTATANTGTISWYASTTSTTALGTGTTFTTPSITSSTTYYAEALSGICKSARVPVLAEYNSIIPTLSNPIAGPTRCDTGSVLITASTNYGSVYWYNNGGTILLDTGNTFNTPAITSNTTFYVRAIYKGCTTGFKTVDATVIIPPIITATTPTSICQGQSSAVITATSTGGGSIVWYADSTTTTVSFSSNGPQGIYSITPAPTATKKYYVQGSRSGCSGKGRIPVTVTVKPLPTITSTTPAARCGAGTVTLNATSTAGTTINWFLSSTDVVPTSTASNSFTTPVLSASKTYYLLPSSLNGCSTTVRTTIVATVNAEPSSVVTVNGNTLTATETGATYQWINCGNSANITGATLQSYTAPGSGSYKVTVTKNTCAVTSACTNLTITGTEDETSNQTSFKIYPNPSNGDFTIEQSENSTIEILNNAGQLVMQIPATAEKSFKVSGLSDGMYFVRTSKDGIAKTHKVVVAK